MQPRATPQIGPAQAALIEGRVSIIVGTGDAERHPHVMRAVGCRFATSGQRLRILMAASRSRGVLDDLRANRRIAVVFSEPSTHRTLQLKGEDAEIVAADAADLAAAERYVAAFSAEIGMLGFAADVARRLVGCPAEDLVAIEFHPSAAYDQTPGPGAGAALAGTVGS